jgi:hypothetical protein
MTLALSIQLTSTDGGRSDSFTVDAERVRIGSAAYCEVRLPHGEAAPLQIVLEDAGPLGLRADVLSDTPPPTVDDKPLISGILPPNAVIGLGRMRLTIATLGGAVVGTGPAKKRKTSPVTLLAAVIAIPLGLAQLSFPAKDDEMATGHQPPALFASARAECPQAEPTAARALAAEQRALASAKRERRPFRASDGVRAVRLFRVTAACSRVGGDADRALDAERAAQVLEADLDESYRTHRVRLEHALSTKNYQVAQVEVRALRELTSGQSGEYISWLESLARRLSLRQGKKP